MGNRYYATVTFPAAAKVIPEVAALLELDHYEVEYEDDTTIKVIDDQANYGRMDEITHVLDRFKVPYDHEESPGSSDEVNCTHYVRWPTGPDRVAKVLVGEEEATLVTVNDSDYEVSTLAAQCLGHLDRNDLAGLRELLESKQFHVEALDEIEWKAPV